MKFYRGAWLLEQGVKTTPVRRVFDYKVYDSKLWLAALDRTGTNGVDRFEGQVLQVEVSSPLPDVIRVRAYRHSPSPKGWTSFELRHSDAQHISIDETDDSLRFRAHTLSLKVPRAHHWSMDFEADHQKICAGEGLSFDSVDGIGNFLTQRLSLGVGETIYGLGERFGPLVKNGQTVVIWNEDGGTNSEWSYKNIPFYLSSAGYGLFVNSPGKIEFEFGTERVSQIQFSAPGEELDYFFIYGPSPKEILSKYTQLTGRPAVPPAWSNGLWLSTSFTTTYDEKTVTEFVSGMAERDIPLKVFHFDCFWMKERQWCDFEWDRDAFPDPEGMLKRLKSRGLKICVWINSYISGLSKLFKEGSDCGYFIKNSDGSVFQRDQWQPSMAIVDFSNPAAVNWFQSKLRKLLEMGVDCFKTDFGERIPDEGVVYHDGTDPKLMHNLYPYLYNKAVFELLEDYHGKGNAMVFARSATAGCQQFPVHWGGDCEATFESMAEDLRGGLSFCMSGPAFWSHDIGGFSGKADPAVYKRWVAFGLMSTHSRLHGSESYRVPWLFDEESVDVMRFFAKLKNRLFPYLYSIAHDAAIHGWPALRSMFVEFPDDPTCRHLDRQYMLGENILVAPIFRHDNIAEYYLPNGTWTNLLTNQVTKGGRWIRETHGFMSMPIWIRQNTLMPITNQTAEPEWKIDQPVLIRLYQVQDRANLKLNLISSDRKELIVHCRREGRSISLNCDGRPGAINISLDVGTVTNVQNASASATDDGRQTLRWKDLSQPMSFLLPEVTA